VLVFDHDAPQAGVHGVPGCLYVIQGTGYQAGSAVHMQIYGAI
jgi:hypothetical protein